MFHQRKYFWIVFAVLFAIGVVLRTPPRGGFTKEELDKMGAEADAARAASTALLTEHKDAAAEGLRRIGALAARYKNAEFEPGPPLQEGRGGGIEFFVADGPIVPGAVGKDLPPDTALVFLGTSKSMQVLRTALEQRPPTDDINFGITRKQYGDLLELLVDLQYTLKDESALRLRHIPERLGLALEIARKMRFLLVLDDPSELLGGLGGRDSAAPKLRSGLVLDVAKGKVLGRILTPVTNRPKAAEEQASPDAQALAKAVAELVVPAYLADPHPESVAAKTVDPQPKEPSSSSK